MIKDFKYYNNDKRIFNEEIKDNIPSKILDFHVHLFKKEHIIKEVSQSKKEKDPFFNFEVIDEFTIDNFIFTAEIIFPGIEYEGLFFGAPFREMDLNSMNTMVAEEIIKTGKYGLFIPKPEDDIKNIEKNIIEKGFLGLKPYPELAIGKEYREDLDSVSILDFLTVDHLELANRYNLLIILHIPKSKRLIDDKNIEDITYISKTFPDIKLILAHAGRLYCEHNIVETIKKICLLKNVYVDTAMINNWEVFEILLEYFGSERIIFGTDLPIAILRGKNICINNNHYFFTSVPYLWSISNKNLKEENITFFLYEEIKGILKAVNRKKLDKQVINNIFYNNAYNLISSVKI
ncbi:MAG: amidohydrolase [Actinobacteria bacterium]|nr:amidohydrolase [Actinomycetota bacterium]